MAFRLILRFRPLAYSSGDTDKVAVETTARKIDQVLIDNTSGTSQVYLRLYDVASGSVTLGTTSPDVILPCAAGAKCDYSFQPANAFSTAITANLTISTAAAQFSAVTSTVTFTILTSA